MFWVLMATLCGVQASWGENLVRNPGFDELAGDGTPAGWDLFVQPMPGALGRADSGAFEGAHAAVLDNPEAYAEEPYNNWSQVIESPPVEGTVVMVKGNIRTGDTAEGAIWLQCWRKGPTRVIGAVTSDETTRVSGNSAWTPIEMKLTVPKDTAFLVVRCVLKGKGRAWFDGISLEKAPDAAAAVADGAKPEAKPDGAAAAPPATPTDGASASSPTPAAESATASAPTPGPTKEEDLGKAVRETNAAMLEALRELRTSNESLMQQITALQAELTSLRSEVKDSGAVAPPGTPPMETGTPAPEAAHPLVPRDYKKEGPRP